MEEQLVIRTESQSSDGVHITLEGGLFIIPKVEWDWYVQCATTPDGLWIVNLVEKAMVFRPMENTIRFVEIVNFTAPLQFLRQVCPMPLLPVKEASVKVAPVKEASTIDRSAEVAKIIKQAKQLDIREKKREELAAATTTEWTVVGKKK